MAWPCGVCTTSGWNCTAWRRRSTSSIAATGASGVVAVTWKPVGRRADRVEVAHPHLLVGRLATSEQHAGGDDLEIGAAVLASTGAGDDPAELLGEELRAVADAEHRDIEVVHAGVDAGAPSTCTDAGPPLRMMPAGCPIDQLGGGDRVGHDLAVDVRLTDAPGDELGVLRAEVDDEDGTGRGHEPARRSPASPSARPSGAP